MPQTQAKKPGETRCKIAALFFHVEQGDPKVALDEREALVSDFKFLAMTDWRIDEFETLEPSIVTSEGITEVCAS